MNMKIDMYKVARKMYEQYCVSCSHVAHNGDDLPTWEQLDSMKKYYWTASARAGISEFMYQMEGIVDMS